jgi:CubicO group peptidase (beta-lactamase class C family)
MGQNKTIETPIRPYLPIDLPTLQCEQIEINFKHILMHTAGLPYFPDNFSFSIYRGNVDGVFANYDNNNLFTSVKNMRLRSKPFTRFEYSNMGFALMGIL